MRVLINNGCLSDIFFMHRHQLMDRMKENGCKIYLTGMRNKEYFLKKKTDYQYYDFDVPASGISPVSDLKLILSYRKFVRRHHIDMVHSYTAKANIYGSIGARLGGVREIYPVVNGLGYVYTEDARRPGYVKKLMNLLYRLAFLCAKKVIFQNKDDALEMQRNHTIPADKCVIISGSGIDVNDYDYCPIYDRNTFLMGSRLMFSKGVMTYCEAARIVKKKYPNAQFLLAGSFDSGPDGIKNEHIQEYIDRGDVVYLGYVKNLKEVIRKCAVFILPSYYREGIPHSLLEAMSIGRAIITCDSPGCRETIKNIKEDGKGENGFGIPPKSIDALTDAISWMNKHPDAVKQMGIESRKYAEERFDVNKVNNTILETMGIL